MASRMTDRLFKITHHAPKRKNGTSTCLGSNGFAHPHPSFFTDQHIRSDRHYTFFAFESSCHIPLFQSPKHHEVVIFYCSYCSMRCWSQWIRHASSVESNGSCRLRNCHHGREWCSSRHKRNYTDCRCGNSHESSIRLWYGLHSSCYHVGYRATSRGRSGRFPFFLDSQCEGLYTVILSLTHASPIISSLVTLLFKFPEPRQRNATLCTSQMLRTFPAQILPRWKGYGTSFLKENLVTVYKRYELGMRQK